MYTGKGRELTREKDREAMLQKAGRKYGSAISTPDTVTPTAATAAEDFRGEAEATADTGPATASNTDDSTAIVAAAAEWLK
jgi:hypothetical protein